MKVGDIVRLKSGGPPMTVVHAANVEQVYQCCWFTREGKIEASDFRIDTLQILKHEDGKFIDKEG